MQIKASKQCEEMQSNAKHCKAIQSNANHHHALPPSPSLHPTSLSPEGWCYRYIRQTSAAPSFGAPRNRGGAMAAPSQPASPSCRPQALASSNSGAGPPPLRPSRAPRPVRSLGGAVLKILLWTSSLTRLSLTLKLGTRARTSRLSRTSARHRP